MINKVGLQKIKCCACVLFLSVLMTGCADKEKTEKIENVQKQITWQEKEADFREGKHERSEKYPAVFKTYVTESEQVALHIRQDCFEEESAKQAWSKVQKDYRRMVEKLQLEEPEKIEVYLVAEEAEEDMVVDGKKLYCALSEFTDESYLEGMTQVVFGVKEPWQKKGMKGYLLEEEAEEEVLKDYYSGEKNLNVLSMFAAYFNVVFTDEETRQYAEKTAVAFTNYLINTYDVQIWKESGAEEAYRNEWLEKLGSGTTYSRKYNLDMLVDAEYGRNKKYAFTATLPNGSTFYVNTMQGEIEKAEDIMRVVDGIQKGVDLIFERIKKEAPGVLEDVKANWENGIGYRFGDDIEGAYEILEDKHCNCYIGRIEAVLHETVHGLIPVGNRGVWQYEGIAVLLSVNIDSLLWNNYGFYSYIAEEATWEENEDDKALRESVVQYYMEKEERPSKEEELNMELVYEALGYTLLNYPNLNVTTPPMAHLSIAESARKKAIVKGDALTYPEAYYVIHTMVDEFGMEKVLRFCLEQESFDRAFGVEETEYINGVSKRIRLERIRN